MTRQTEARANRELAATRQRPWEPPQATPRRLTIGRVVFAVVVLLAAAWVVGGVL